MADTSKQVVAKLFSIDVMRQAFVQAYLQNLPKQGPRHNNDWNNSGTVGTVWLESQGKNHYDLVIALQVSSQAIASSWQQGVKQVTGTARDLLCAQAKPIGLLGAVYGETESVAQTHLGLSLAGSYCGIPQLTYATQVGLITQSYSYVQTIALGIKARIENSASNTSAFVPQTGYNIIFIGSIETQPDELFVNHLIAAQPILYTKLQQTKLVNEQICGNISTTGILGAALSLVHKYNLTLNINLDEIKLKWEQLLQSNNSGLIWLASNSATKIIMEHFTNTWEMSALSSNIQVMILGKTQEKRDQIFTQQQTILDNTPADTINPLKLHSETKPWHSRTHEPQWSEVPELEQAILRLLSHPTLTFNHNIKSQYDTTVGGSTIVEAAVTNTSVIAPLLEEKLNVGLVANSTIGNLRYGLISPYWQAINNVIASVRRVVAAGATPWCISFGCHHKKQLTPDWSFTEIIKGINDTVQQLKIQQYQQALPVVAQNIDFYDTELLQELTHLIPTAIHCLGKINDVAAAITIDFIQPGNIICLLGERRNELGGSILYSLYNEVGANVPQPKLTNVQQELLFMSEVITQGLVPTCHTISSGGLVKTLADMCYGLVGQLKTGVEIDLQTIPAFDLTNTQKIFSETSGFVFEADSRLLPSILRHAKNFGLTIYPIGKIRDDELFVLRNGSTTVLTLPVGELAEQSLNISTETK